ncbi:MAG: tRNA (guanosine(46)-N7)-methyltransferase TrmB [Gammaproteobacteria bacterium]|nr:tRNA (guanosine(46)-N7)-methyltransferase TrmB [Gammaproteobacteria bacterium]
MNPQAPRIKSFVRREGRSSVKRKLAFDKLWPQFGIEPDSDVLDFDKLFARHAPCFLEIGFGTGTALIETASNHPQNNYLGVEVYRTGIASLLNQVDELGLTNIRVFNNDAVDILNKQIEDRSLDGIFLFFPDPWHKQRHQKRRLVQAEFIQLVVQKLKPGAVFHAATDWQDYAQQMMTVLSANPKLTNVAGAQNYSPRPEYRPITKFEQRGQKLGHGVWDLLFQRTV